VLTGTSAIARDISKRIANERELQVHREELARLVEEKTKELTESQERLRNAERLAAMGALAAGIAHEINSPIGAILLTAENSLNSSEESDSIVELKAVVRKANRKIIHNANRCSLIVKEALKYSRRKKTQKWSNNLNAIIQNAYHLVQQHAYANGSRIVLELQENLPKLSLNPIEMEQLLVNLIKNAIDSSDSMVTVQVTTEVSKTGHIVLQISDDGPGIPEDEKNRIFEPFYTTRISQGGTGLGLSIVKQIVKSHSGFITVESKLGSGTRFKVSFPLGPEQTYKRPTKLKKSA
jgi:signal transduction histidine kinase